MKRYSISAERNRRRESNQWQLLRAFSPPFLRKSSRYWHYRIICVCVWNSFNEVKDYFKLQRISFRNMMRQGTNFTLTDHPWPIFLAESVCSLELFTAHIPLFPQLSYGYIQIQKEKFKFPVSPKLFRVNAENGLIVKGMKENGKCWKLTNAALTSVRKE